MNKCISLLAMLILMSTTIANAGMIIDTGEPTSSSGMVIGYNTPSDGIGQMVSLEVNFTESVSISTIYLHLGRLEEGLNLRVWLSTKIGSDTQESNIVDSWTIWGISGSDSFSGIWYPITVSESLNLDAGSYFITIASGTDKHAVIRWDAPTDYGQNYSASGNKAFPLASDFNETSKNFGLQIEGVYIPEPATLSLMALAGIILQHKRKA